MKQLAFIVLLLGQTALLAQKIGPTQATEDLNFLMENIQQYNPALSQYHPDFEQGAKAVIANAPKDSCSIFEHFSNVSRICALANEGHFKVGDWKDAVHQGILANTAAYLPLEVAIIGGKLYVMEDYSDEQQLKAGNEVLAINGKTIEDILDQLVAVTPSDGNILTYAHRKIESSFPFSYYFYIERPAVFNLTIQTQDQAQKELAIKALIRSTQVDNYKKYYANNTAKETDQPTGFYTLKINDRYALLTLPSFDFKRVQQFDVKSKRLYRTIFKTLRENGVKNLVIDLRDNTGGRNEFADDMIPFILKKPSADPFQKQTISWDEKKRTSRMPRPSKWAFKGAIYALVNGKTYSAGHSLARFLKEHGDATIVGTETGTRYEGFAAGSKQHIMLPHAQWDIGIPRYHILFPVSKKQTTTNRGLLPDYYITPTLEARLNNTDLHLEKIRSLIP